MDSSWATGSADQPGSARRGQQPDTHPRLMNLSSPTAADKFIKALVSDCFGRLFQSQPAKRAAASGERRRAAAAATRSSVSVRLMRTRPAPASP